MSVVEAIPFSAAGASASTRAPRSLIGRQVELEAIENAVDAAQASLVGVSVEGEPGIGKTTLLGAAAEMAVGRGMVPVIAIVDEEIRGPMLLARSIFGSPDLRVDRAPAIIEELDGVQRLLEGEEDANSLTAGERRLRAFDKAATALRTIAADRPIALLIDDVQWADQDSIRLLRYVIRANAAEPMFLMFTIRPEEMAQVAELVTLLADLERLGILRRLRVERLRQNETAALLRQLLAGDVSLASAATIHAQAEGVPFIVAELTRTYRDAGLLQPIGGTWNLARNAERLVPSAVRTLISRRAASLDAPTKELLATGAVLGRAFRLADICAIRAKLGETIACEVGEASELIAPAITAGLITEGGSAGNRYLTFAHEQVREYALDTLSSARRRQLHSAVVDMLAEAEPTPETLPIIVRHAVAAGDTARIARYSLDAARAALTANAPEEALRLVEEALGVVSDPAQRAEMLRVRDDALGALGRSIDRLQAISELVALAEATGDERQRSDAQLRRAAALRGDDRFEAAADVARKVRTRAAAAGDTQTELRACLELGQALLRAQIGEGYASTPHESDLDGAEEAFGRAVEIAQETRDEGNLAIALRELGAIKNAHIRAWFVERVQAGDHIPFVMRIANGEPLEEIEKELPVADQVKDAAATLTRALELFEKQGDRRGAMSAIVSLAYLQWAPEMHLGTNPALRFEGIRQLANTMETLVQESEREQNEAQMLYGVHVFAHNKLIPDLALQRGEEAYKRARSLGDVALEFLAAIGVARENIDLGNIEAAERWLARANDAAAVAPTPHRARQLAIAHALIAAARGNGEQMRAGLQEAARMAAAQRRPAAQCEALALMALETARIGAAENNDDLLSTAESAAAEARRLCADLAGHPLWAAQAAAATSEVALARGDNDSALELARLALAERHAAMREDWHLEILLPAARAILAAGEESEKQTVLGELHVIQGLTVQRVLDDAIRVQWLRGPLGKKLGELIGPYKPMPREAQSDDDHRLEEADSRLLRLLTEGRTNREIAEELGVDEPAVMSQLAALYARIGAQSRAEATAFAFRTHA